MNDLDWSQTEKKLARRVFDEALRQELAEIMAEFKAKATRATTPEEMWSVGEYLVRAQRAVEEKYDYRYSRLLEVFGVLLSEKRIEENELGGLGAEKLAVVRRIAGFMSEVRGAR